MLARPRTAIASASIGLGLPESVISTSQLGRPVHRVRSLPVVALKSFDSEAEVSSDEEVEHVLGCHRRRQSMTAQVEFAFPTPPDSHASFWSPSSAGSPFSEAATPSETFTPHPALHMLSPKQHVLANAIADDALAYGWLLPMIDDGVAPVAVEQPTAPKLVKAPSMASTASASSSGRYMRRTTSTLSASSFASASTAPTSDAGSVLDRKRPARLVSSFFASSASEPNLALVYRRGSSSSLASPVSLTSPTSVASRRITSPLNALEPVMDEPETAAPDDDPRTALVAIWARADARDAVHRRRTASAAIVATTAAPSRHRQPSSKGTIRKIASMFGLRQRASADSLSAPQLDAVREPCVRRQPSIEQMLSEAALAVGA